MMSYCEVVNYMLATCPTDDIIPKADMPVIIFKQPAGQSGFKYGKRPVGRPYGAGLSTTNFASTGHSLKR